MISRKNKLLAAAAGMVALIATVAVARTVHTHTNVATPAQVSGKVTGTTPAQTTPLAHHGILTCGMALDSDCEKFETFMPM